MSDYYESSRVKRAKKHHYCTWCCEPILMGDPYTSAYGVHEGSPFRDPWHNECYSAVQAEAQRQKLSLYTYDFEKHTRGVCGKEDIGEQ